MVEDVGHGQWSALTREKRIRQAAEFDQARYGYGAVTYYVEQEPGSGGKESAERTVRDTLRGFAAYPDKVTGDKVTCLTQAGHCASTCGRSAVPLFRAWRSNRAMPLRDRRADSRAPVSADRA